MFHGASLVGSRMDDLALRQTRRRLEICGYTTMTKPLNFPVSDSPPESCRVQKLLRRHVEMARIFRIVVTQHQLPLDPPFPASWDTRPRTRFPAKLVRVFDEDGRMGVGSGDAMLGFSAY